MAPTTETNPISTPTRTNYVKLLWCVFLSAVVFLALGPVLSYADPLWGIVLTEIIAIAAPAVYLRKKLSTQKRDTMNFREVALLTLALFPVILVLNGVFLEGLSRVSLLENQNLDMIRTEASLIKQILTLALFPAIMEELFFRGMICEQFARRSPLGGVFFSAFLFALFHFQWQNSLAPFLFGLVLGYIYIYGGLKASIFSHFIYNLSSILLIRFLSDSWTVTLSQLSFTQGLGGLKNMMTVVLLISSAIGIFSILRKSLKRPLPKGRAVIRKKEWIPIIALIIVYVIKTIT